MGFLTKAEKREMNKAAWAAKNEEKRAQWELEKKVERAPIGTKDGNKQRIAEFKNRLLSATVGETMIRKLIEIAQDDDHPGQMAALKMAIDRIVPASIFEEKKDLHERPTIQISFSNIGQPKPIETIDG